MLTREAPTGATIPPGGRGGRSRRAPWASALRLASIAICLATAAGIAVERYTTTDPQRSSTPARLLQAVAAAAAIALAPAALAVMAGLGRPVLLVPAAMALWAFGSAGVGFFPVLVPLLGAAALLVVAFALSFDGLPCGWREASPPSPRSRRCWSPRCWRCSSSTTCGPCPP